LAELIVFDDIRMIKQLHNFDFVHDLLYVVFIVIVYLDPFLSHQFTIFDSFNQYDISKWTLS